MGLVNPKLQKKDPINCTLINFATCFFCIVTLFQLTCGYQPKFSPQENSDKIFTVFNISKFLKLACIIYLMSPKNLCRLVTLYDNCKENRRFITHRRTVSTKIATKEIPKEFLCISVVKIFVSDSDCCVLNSGVRFTIDSVFLLEKLSFFLI
jgi:hypothetical protein